MEVKYEPFSKALRKYNEELCGDVIKVVETPEKFTAVLSDGLGSGVKASILATLTTEIIATMLKEDIDLFETIETVTNTLPICRERGIAYSTFSVVQGDSEGNVRVINFDNPDPILILNGKVMKLTPEEKLFADKRVKIWHLKAKPGDLITLISDGVVYAGLGGVFDFGWGWDNVADYVRELYLEHRKPQYVVSKLLDMVFELYGNKCYDDASAIAILIRELRKLVIFTGPPLNPDADEKIVEKFLSLSGKKVVCGGTTVNIVARYLGVEPEMDITTARPDVPPMGYMEGVDLATEGVLTISKTIELLKTTDFNEILLPEDRNAAVELAKMLIDADEIYIIMGQKINPFYQNPDLPSHISIRKSLIEEMVRLLREHGKKVTLEFC